MKTDRILEIGAVRMEDGRATDTFHALIHPHRTIPEPVTQLTGITQEMADSGEELCDVLPRFLAFANALPLLGHNLSYDFSFLKQAYVNEKQTFERSGIDTLRLARRFLPKEQRKNLEALRAYFSIDTGTVHRAVSDACAAALVYERLRADFYADDPAAFAPVPLRAAIKKQQPLTIPQKEQLQRLLSACTVDIAEIEPASTSIDRLTRSEASRLG